MTRPVPLVSGTLGALLAGLCCLGWAPLVGLAGAAGLGAALDDRMLLPIGAGFVALALWGARAAARRQAPEREARPRAGDACSVGAVRGRRGLLLWGAPLAAIAAGALAPGLAPALWVPALAFLGIVCVANARRCGRLHCYGTGPLFLAAATLLALGAAGGVSAAWTAPLRWIVPASVVLAFGIEWVSGRRYAGPGADR